ncbi:Beta-glucan synthesis-associated protein [Wickerhamomyces ciferrii]|uniref:Beta-glucan synthesis-associated protein n=1 Tax=Wickerhamomyces ciferrii (strain ATCC 14091 / BCRC 22168 / CBS 111 / JCM 3599 / NBRC 0793 / NRRL Y-1031 F-60-10) TaxID=1206466 RepID=K0KM54_WICCF|nr:Beta-glucan synthesis-associated protein [Wickerhamomyces ciferrii]CCH46325.1 Beta-glucan synthesis-associated protein [Wickerhamomyces ciferrii]
MAGEQDSIRNNKGSDSSDAGSKSDNSGLPKEKSTQNGQTKLSNSSTFSLKNVFTPKSKRESSYQLDNLAEMQQMKENVLNNFSVNSDIYKAHNYSDTLSDDEEFIFEDDLPKPGKSAQVTTRVINTSSESSATSENGSMNNVVERDHFINAQYLKSPSKHDLAERGELKQEGEIAGDELSRLERWKANFKNKKASLREMFGTKNWERLVILIVMIIIISVLSFVIPFVARSDKLSHRVKPPKVYEHLTDYIYPQLSAIRTEMVDDSTPESAYKRKNKDGEDWELVFSDEFSAEGRTFYPGMDQFWEAVNLNYAATKDLEWYEPDAVSTQNGTLNLRMDVHENHDLFYRSGMVQSWNKLCFTEGILEISAKLPGSASAAGLWPGLWTLGNLARAGYMASTEGVWPYSYDECDAGITANQSSNDGISQLPGQKLNKCTCKGEDHPNRGTGRGAPEVDLLEGAHSDKLIFGVASQTIQIAPFDIWYQPDYDYVAIHNLSISNQNSFRGTPFQEMVSTITTLNDHWFQQVVDKEQPNVVYEDEETHFQKFAVEYLSKAEKRKDTYTRFFVGDEPTVTIQGEVFHPDGNIGWRDMSKEPMSIILNLGISTAWSNIDWLFINFPVQFQIDYVRIYQPKGKTQLTCDPGDYPTQDYISKHLNAYMNPNLTSWEAAGYEFPKNKLVHGCK